MAFTKEEKLERVRKWKKDNKDKVKAYKKKYYKKQLELQKKWREKNREYIKKYRKDVLPLTQEWKRNRKKINPSYKISETVRSYLSRKIRGKIKKNTKTEKILGISYKNFTEYLASKFKPGMTLANYGEWHIDHIKPVTKFDLTKPGELEKCFHYTNLQPLWAKENIRKSNKY